jgi:hypothetical protein
MTFAAVNMRIQDMVDYILAGQRKKESNQRRQEVVIKTIRLAINIQN